MTNDWIQGMGVSDFERSFASYCETRYAVGCGNGSDALALRTYGISEGDEVVDNLKAFVTGVPRSGTTMSALILDNE